MRLIDADALKKEILRKLCPRPQDFLIPEEEAIIDCIDDAPTVEQHEIIRCRDCCYWIPGLITDNDCFIPPKCGKYQRGKYQQMVGHFADDYCSYGEGREVSK